jgi:hypothetical protein
MNDSPFYSLAQHPGVKQSPRPPVAYNSLFQVVRVFEESALPIEEADILAHTVAKSYNLVKKIWPEAWGKDPSHSKLMHGGGLRAMASVLASKIAATVSEGNGDINDPTIWQRLDESLERLKTRVVWTDSEAAQASTTIKKIWREEISDTQSTSQGIRALIKFLKKQMLSLDVAAKKPTKAIS